MNRPFFSIATPCLNCAATIERTLQSVLKQDYDDYEYIVVDGGSTDGTIDIIKRYEPLFKGRMKWTSEPDKGLYDAFNKGAKKSVGVYCWNVNADDYIEKSALRTIYNKTIGLAKEELPIISAASRYFYRNGDFAYIKRLNQENADRLYKIANIGINHPATLVPKQVYDQVGYYDDRYSIMGDMDWFRRAYEAHLPFLYIDEIITNMNEGGVSTQLNLKKISKDRWLYTQKFYKRGFSRVAAFSRWLAIYLKGQLKYMLVKKGLMKR